MIRNKMPSGKDKVKSTAEVLRQGPKLLKFTISSSTGSTHHEHIVRKEHGENDGGSPQAVHPNRQQKGAAYAYAQHVLWEIH